MIPASLVNNSSSRPEHDATAACVAEGIGFATCNIPPLRAASRLAPVGMTGEARLAGMTCRADENMRQRASKAAKSRLCFRSNGVC